MNNPIKRPLVSICCVSFNQSLYIEKCLDGFDLKLCNFDFEVLIFDDASTDDNQQRILRHAQDKKNYRLFLQNENQWNKNKFGFIDYLIPAANGKYIALCEGDDYWTDPYKLQKQVDFLEANPDYVLSFHKVKILQPNGDLVEDFITKVPENYETQETLARLGNYIHTPSVVFRNIIKEFPPEFSLTPIGDYFLYMLLSEHGKLKYLEEEMAVYRYGVGIHSTHTQIKMAKANFKLFTLLLSYFNNPKINQILLGRQLNALDNFEHLVRSEYQEAFVSHHVFFKALQSLKHPSKFWRKIKNKFN
ncbi:MAG: glycosyltransferase [Flavobacterium sp.]|nr:MAG: glycosyltransferase [Flavobacterium sp.]